MRTSHASIPRVTEGGQRCDFIVCIDVHSAEIHCLRSAAAAGASATAVGVCDAAVAARAAHAIFALIRTSLVRRCAGALFGSEWEGGEGGAPPERPW